jgi:thiopeptide-type bacteriocin biosynthesis protein
MRILRERSAALAPIVDQLHAAEAAGQLTTTVPGLVESYLHMHLNRILRSEQRAQELVIYDFLLRAHRSARARQ